MDFIVNPAPVESEAKGLIYITMCALCSEDPKFCPPLW